MVIWKGINFRDKGIIVEKKPTITKAKKNIDIYTIPGRNGFLSIDNGTYEQFTLSLECHLNPNLTSIDKIKEFLDGYGTLSIDEEREYTAIIDNSISFDQVVRFKKFLVQFLVNPISEDKEYTSFNVTENTTLTINDATFNMYPILEITGSGNLTITINNNTFYLKNIDGKCILDCKNKVITSNGNNIANKMQYDFPILKPGTNSITYSGTITSFLIKYKKAYL